MLRSLHMLHRLLLWTLSKRGILSIIPRGGDSVLWLVSRKPSIPGHHLHLWSWSSFLFMPQELSQRAVGISESPLGCEMCLMLRYQEWASLRSGWISKQQLKGLLSGLFLSNAKSMHSPAGDRPLVNCNNSNTLHRSSTIYPEASEDSADIN